MKKILYIGNNLKANNPTTLVQLTEVLRKHGFEVVIYATKKNKLLRLLDMCLGVVKHKNADYILIDTFSTVSFYYALITSQLARVFSVKYIPILHGGNLVERINRNPFLSQLIFQNSKINVSPSTYFLKEFQKRNFKTICIPNAIPIAKYPFTKRTKLQPKLLWVRAFDKIYNPAMAIKVLALVKKEYPKVALCMVGSDKDGTLLKTKQLAKQLHVENAVAFTGILPKQKWHKLSENYDIFINTTNIDNMPVSVIEAMALGLPVVSTNVGGMPYLINNTMDGVLVSVNDEVKMANEIIHLINNPLVSIKIAKLAREKVKTFDSEKAKKMWVKLLSN